MLAECLDASQRRLALKGEQFLMGSNLTWVPAGVRSCSVAVIDGDKVNTKVLP